MGTNTTQFQRRLVEYDALRRRLWILGQRCHHGATGTIVAGVACAGLLVRPARPGSVMALATASALMAHDWKDHTIWFERGHGNQP